MQAIKMYTSYIKLPVIVLHKYWNRSPWKTEHYKNSKNILYNYFTKFSNPFIPMNKWTTVLVPCDLDDKSLVTRKLFTLQR